MLRKKLFLKCLVAVLLLVGCTKQDAYRVFVKQLEAEELANLKVGSMVYTVYLDSKKFDDCELDPNIIDQTGFDGAIKAQFKSDVLAMNTAFMKTIKESLNNNKVSKSDEKEKGLIVFRLEVLKDDHSDFLTCYENEVCTLEVNSEKNYYSDIDVDALGNAYAAYLKQQGELTAKYYSGK